MSIMSQRLARVTSIWRGQPAERKMHYAFIADVNVHGHGVTVVIIIAVFLARKTKSARRKSRDNGVFEMKRRQKLAKGGRRKKWQEKGVNSPSGSEVSPNSKRKETYSQYLAALGSFPPPTSRKSDGRSLLRFFLRLLMGNL